MEKLKNFFKKIGGHLYAILVAIIGVLLAVIGLKNKSIDKKKETIKEQETEIKTKTQELKNEQMVTAVKDESATNAVKIKQQEVEKIQNADSTKESYNTLIEEWNAK